MVPESKEGATTIWYSYIINLKKITIIDILINSKGYGQVDNEQRKTTTLRYFLEKLGPQEFFKIELINPKLLHLAHEFWVSFREKDKMLDKKYIFLPNTSRKRKSLFELFKQNKSSQKLNIIILVKIF